MDFFGQVFDYLNSGGFVMWPLMVSIFVLWYAIGFRFHRLKRGSTKSVRMLIAKAKKKSIDAPTNGIIDTAVLEAVTLVKSTPKAHARKIVDEAMMEYEIAIKRYKVLIKTIVVSAPLVGLLGTVIGMIETFDSLASMNLFSQSGGIAGGISQALFTTQFGLVVAVPGVILGRLLDKKEARLNSELLQVKDLVLSKVEYKNAK